MAFQREGIFPVRQSRNPERGPISFSPRRPLTGIHPFLSEKLRMLAAKTTCKDRWRQILNEADRIQVKHLLTLQEGVSENQFREMCGSGVRLVVPEGLHHAYPGAVRPELLSLEKFIKSLRLLGPKTGYYGESIAAEDFPNFHK